MNPGSCAKPCNSLISQPNQGPPSRYSDFLATKPPPPHPKPHCARTKHRPHLRHFECRMCCKKQHKHMSSVSALTHARNISTSSAGCAAYKNQCKWHVTPFILTHARNIGHTDAKGTSGAGCAVKSNTNGMSVFARLRQRRS